MPRIVASEGNFENIEEFIQVDGRVTADEIAEQPGFNRGTVCTVTQKELQFKYC